VWRREFLKSAGAATTALATGAGAGGSSADGRDLLDAHIALRAVHGRLDNLRGASAIYAQATDHHQQILAWHNTTESATERRQIAALAADTGGFVGFLTYDLGLAEQAATHYRDAATLAREAGDLSSYTYLIGQMSRILTDQGHYRRTVMAPRGPRPPPRQPQRRSQRAERPPCRLEVLDHSDDEKPPTSATWTPQS
jgi:hypothetical protein